MTSYQRLIPRERGWFGYSELWADSDHLLQLRSSRFAEDYQRFRWKDIQSISITELPHGTGTQWAAIFITGFLMLAGWLIPSAWGWRIFFGIWGTVAFPIALRELLRGPKCRCFLHTAAGTELLAAVARIHTAERLLPDLRARIAAVQGVLSVTAPLESVIPQAPPRPEMELPEPNRRVAYLLVGLWAAMALLEVAGTYWDKTGQTAFISLGAAVVEIILAILVIRQFVALDYLWTRRIAGGALVFQVIDLIIGITYLTLMFRDTTSGAARADFLSLPYANWSVAFSATWRVIAAAAGYWSLRKARA